MKYFSILTLVFSALLILPVEAQLPPTAQNTPPAPSSNPTESVVSTLDNVDLVAVVKNNEAGHNHGTDYFIVNNNVFAVAVSIKVINGENIDNGLAKDILVVPPKQRAYLGYVIQDIQTQKSAWNLEWYVSRP